MDLRAYYKKVREAEAGLAEPFVLVFSLETSDGGKPGVLTEVPRYTAAKLIVDGRGRAATPEEAREHYDKTEELRGIAEQEAAANRMHVMVVPSNDLKTGSSTRVKGK